MHTDLPISKAAGTFGYIPCHAWTVRELSLPPNKLDSNGKRKGLSR